MTSSLATASLWTLIATSACAAASKPASVAAPVEPAVAVREPNPPLDIVISPDEFGPPRATVPPPEPQPPPPEPTFEPTYYPWHNPSTVVSKGRRGCNVTAVLDPEVIVVYSMIDVYALIAKDLHSRLDPPLPYRAEDPPCADGVCQPNAPNAVLINHSGTTAINGRALGFVVPSARATSCASPVARPTTKCPGLPRGDLAHHSTS